MSGKDLLPTTDIDFDIIQQAIIAAAVANSAAWQIPAGEINKLTTAQAPWTSAWQIARIKQTCTTAQREDKKQSRKALSKILRPFIQRWLYRNELVDNEAILKCGLRPRAKSGRQGALPPVPSGFTLTRLEPGVLQAVCKRTEGTDNYGCIVSEGAPLPAWFRFNSAGQLSINPAAIAQNPGMGQIILDDTKSRKKKFSGLKPGVDYYFYFYTVNSNGVSALTNPHQIKS